MGIPGAHGDPGGGRPPRTIHFDVHLPDKGAAPVLDEATEKKRAVS